MNIMKDTGGFIKATRLENEIPKPRSRSKGRELDKETRQMINTIKANIGQIVVFDFYDKRGLLRAYQRLKSAKKAGYVDFEVLARRGESIYVKTKKIQTN